MKHLNLGLILASVLVAATPILAPIGPTAQAQDMPAVKTLRLPLVYYAPYYVAGQMGFDKKNNVKFEFVPISDGAMISPALVNGTLDIAPCAFDGIANMRDKGKDLVALYQLVDQITLDLVMAKAAVPAGITHDSPIADRFAILKGHTFGYTDPGAPSDVFLRVMLRDAGLDPDHDVDLVRVGSISGLFAALKSKQIDGYMLSPPSPQQAEKSGVGTVLIRASAGEIPSISNFYFQNICARKDYIDSYPDRVAAYVKATHEGNVWMRDHKEETLKMFSEMFPNVAIDIWRAAYDLLLPTISPTGLFTQEGVAKAYQVFKQGSAITTIPPTEEGVTWTNRFVK